MLKYYFILFLSLFLFACVSLQSLQLTPEEIKNVQLAKPNITSEQLQNGYKLYIEKCSNCHRLHNPIKYDLAAGQPLLIKMFKKAKINNEAEKQLITQYIAAKKDFIKRDTVLSLH